MDVNEPSGADCDVGASSGVEEAWRVHGRAALHLAAVLVGPHDAHDVTTNAFLRVTKQPNWEQIYDLRSYLMRAVRNEALNLWRANRRRWQRDIVAVARVAHQDHHPDIDVYRALSRLSLRQRTVLFLAYWHDMTETEIADVLGLSRGSVHRNLQRARERLRKDLT